MPQFFVPQVEAHQQEDAYREIAAFVGASVPVVSSRLYSIVWRHDAVVWTATVGKQLKGVATITKGRGRERREIEVPRSTSDTVLAIFPGVTYLVAHDNRSRIWNLPILTGTPLSVIPFS